jgi:RNA ligase
MNVDFGALNSATKYPSIVNYHGRNPADGQLTSETVKFAGEVLLTEKVDGTGARIICLPDGDYFIGSREELLYAKGDRLPNQSLGIVAELKTKAETAPPAYGDSILVYYLEVYGHRIGSGWKNYARGMEFGHRGFDACFVPMDVLSMPVEDIAHWRQHGGQEWANEAVLTALFQGWAPLVPRLGVVDAATLPTGHEDMYTLMRELLPVTQVALDTGAQHTPEGIVLRDATRGTIAKAKFRDYERILGQSR